jgi:hypothetical protein
MKYYISKYHILKAWTQLSCYRTSPKELNIIPRVSFMKEKLISLVKEIGGDPTPTERGERHQIGYS